MSTLSRAVGLALGYVADRLLGDPARFHPVAGFGRVAGALERSVYADSRSRGVVFTSVLVGSTTFAGALVERSARGHPVVHALVTATATWSVLGGTSLAREARTVDRLLADGDLPGARDRLTHLVGRDPSGLDETEVARATIESVAENTSDAVVAALLLGGLTGIGGLLGYRAANTLDAMVGHHDERYERFGWASARLDDLLNLPGSRVSAAFATVLAPTVGGLRREAWEVWRRDAPDHPSPNAGPVEAAFAGALGIRLGGTNVYGTRVERRSVMGSGSVPVVADIDRSLRLADRVGAGAVAVAVVTAVLVGRLPTRRRRQGH